MQSTLTVVHVVPYYPPHSGGMERAAAELVTALPAWGVRAEVITSDVGLPGSTPAPQHGITRLPAVEVAHTPVMRGLIRALCAIPAGSVVHAHVAHALIPDIAGAVARWRRLPFVAHYHLDVDPTGPMGWLLRPYQRTVLRHTLRTAGAVLVPTPDYAQIVISTFGVQAGRVHVLPNGTSMELAATPRTRPPGTWRLLSVGRLNDQKNHALLLDACAWLLTRAPQLAWTLEIYGDGELRGALTKQIQRLRLEDRVTLRGEGFSAQQMQEAFDHADLFVLATRKESFGIVYAEAMARGVPIVTTDVPGVRNVVRDGESGVLASPSAQALGGAILRCTAEAGFYERLSAGSLRAAQAFRWPGIAQRLADLYRTLLHERPR